MKRLITLLLTTILVLPSFAHAEIKTITHTVQQPFGGSQSPDDARTAGIARAKREALERFGTYIESSTVVKNSQVDSDEILALTAGVTKAEAVKQKSYTEGDAFGLEITVKVELDTAVLDQSLKRLLQDRNHLKDLKDARQREKQLLARIVELEKQNNQQGESEKQKETLKKEFQKTRDGLTAVEWFDKAVALWDGGKYADSKKMVEYLSHAIRFDPSLVPAYVIRGVAYLGLKQYRQAISDYNQAIRLDPSLVPAYVIRGLAYTGLKQYQKAINDFTRAIQLDPNDAQVYSNRGNAYHNLKQYQKAINDYDQATQLDPNRAQAYSNRGNAYHNLKQYQKAINDYDQAIRLDPSLAQAYTDRGLAYSVLKQYQQAIKDYDQAIRLDPNDAGAYEQRGLAYLSSGLTEQGCRDLQQSCKLGECGAIDLFRQYGGCQ